MPKADQKKPIVLGPLYFRPFMHAYNGIASNGAWYHVEENKRAVYALCDDGLQHHFHVYKPEEKIFIQIFDEATRGHIPMRLTKTAGGLEALKALSGWEPDALSPWLLKKLLEEGIEFEKVYWVTVRVCNRSHSSEGQPVRPTLTPAKNI